MEKVLCLSQHDVDSYHDMRKQIRIKEDIITKRVHYILKKIFEACEMKLDCWWVDGANEGEVGDVEKLFSVKDRITNYEVEVIGGTGAKRVYLKLYFKCEEGTLNIIQEFPRRWLFEPFEEELEEGIKKTKQAQSDSFTNSEIAAWPSADGESKAESSKSFFQILQYNPTLQPVHFQILPQSSPDTSTIIKGKVT